MKFDYNSPELKVARVVGILVIAILVIGWLASQYTWVGDMMKSPGLSVLKFLFLLMIFVGIALIIRTAWTIVFGRGAIEGEKAIFSYKIMIAEGVIAGIGLFLWWAAQAGWFGSGWVMFPV